MPKKNRLTGVEIRKARSSNRLHGAFFSLSISPGSLPGKVTCVVSKKVSPLATDRNLIKRRCRASIATHLSQIPAGVFIFTAKREVLKASFEAIQKDITALIQRIKA